MKRKQISPRRTKCPACGYSVRLAKDGRIMAHKMFSGDGPWWCNGRKDEWKTR